MIKTNSAHSFVEELRKSIDNCRQEVLKLLQDWHYLQNILHPRIMFVYDSLFGDLEYELQQKDRIAAELDRRAELLYLKFQKGEKITEKTIQFIKKVVNKEFEHLERTFYSKNNSSPNFNSGKKVYPKDEIPQLYRKIVKSLHPDVTGETENFNKFWYNIQDAYKTRNLRRLQLFHQTLCPVNNKLYPTAYSEELALRNEIRQLKMNIIYEKRKIQRLKQKEPFIYEDKLNDKFWIARRKYKLQEKIFEVDKRIRQNKCRLLSLTGSKCASADLPGDNNRLKNKKEDMFENSYH